MYKLKSNLTAEEINEFHELEQEELDLRNQMMNCKDKFELANLEELHSSLVTEILLYMERK